jgi:hypothetical protein
MKSEIAVCTLFARFVPGLFASPCRDDKHKRRLRQVTSFGLDIKTFLRERNGASSKPKTPPVKCRRKSLDTTHVVRDGMTEG